MSKPLPSTFSCYCGGKTVFNVVFALTYQVILIFKVWYNDSLTKNNCLPQICQLIKNIQELKCLLLQLKPTIFFWTKRHLLSLSVEKNLKKNTHTHSHTQLHLSIITLKCTLLHRIYSYCFEFLQRSHDYFLKCKYMSGDKLNPLPIFFNPSNWLNKYILRTI